VTPELPTGLPDPINTRKRSSEETPPRSRSPKHSRRKSRSPETSAEGSKFGKCRNCTESGHVTKNCPKSTDLRETLRLRRRSRSPVRRLGSPRRRSRSPRRQSR
jgi:hypothetical protein